MELLNNRLRELSFKFNKFLQIQSANITKFEQRKNDLNGPSNKKPNNRNPFMYSSLPNEDDDDIIPVDPILTTKTISYNKNAYYQDRTNAVQSIAKTMEELGSMFTRLSSIVHQQRDYIQK